MQTQTIDKITQQSDKDFDLTQIINGEEVMSPSPFLKHQRIIRKMLRKIEQHLDKNNFLGEVCISPLDVIFADGSNRLQPDLLFIRKDNSVIAQDWIRGVPDMVCEIVSEGTLIKDTVTKKDIYERYKVPEYWIVMPEFKTIQIFALEDNKYILYSYAEIDGIVKSKAIEGLQIDIKDIFFVDQA
ncbi:restriction endonuclease [Candidatus Magnetoovum chiemensis]|nr:restriction endonuclease [Candidatus Magnetoovum chiemensis]